MSIIVEKLTKKYAAQTAVDNISFEVPTGEIIGFLGPNGAGKSSTMKMITCYMPPTSGNIQLDGLSVHENPGAIKRKIGYLPEHNPLYTDMPVVEYLKFSAAIQGVEKRSLPSRVKEMIEVCGLGQESHKRIQELSKGYRQRVGLAQAIIHNPDVLILDEPTTGLDPNQIVEIRSLIKELGREKTVILSSHILSEVEATCDRILIINKGKIVADGKAEALRQQAQGQELLQIGIAGGAPHEIEELLRRLPTVEALSKEQQAAEPPLFRIQSKPQASSKKAVFDLCVQQGWHLTELRSIETKLEDIFRDLTK